MRAWATPSFRQKSETYSRGEPGTLARLRSGSGAGPCRQLSRRPAAVFLYLTALRRAHSRILTAFRPPPGVLPAASGPGLDHQRIGRQDPGPPARPVPRRMPGVRARLVFGASRPDRTVPSASRRSGKPCNRDGHGHSGVLGHHGGVSDDGAGGRFEFARPACTLLALWVEQQGVQPAPYVTITQFGDLQLSRENTGMGSLAGQWAI